MTDNWGGAQWVLATLLTLSVVMPPIIRFGLMRTGHKTNVDWVEYAGARLGDLVAKIGLVAILVWGGFF